MSERSGEIIVIDLEGYPYRLDEDSIAWIEDPGEVRICFRPDGQVLEVLRASGGIRVLPKGAEVLTPSEMWRILLDALECAAGRNVAAVSDLRELWELVERAY